MIRVCALAILLATTSNSAQQSGSFDPQFEGQLFAVRHELLTEGFPAGVTFIDGVLYVADFDTASVHAFDAAGQLVDTPDAEWGLGAAQDASSPLSGLMPNLLSSARVAIVDGATTTEMTALLLSDSSLNRVLVFDVDGRLLFKMQLDWPGVSHRGDYLPDPGIVPVINGMAIGPDSRFVYTPALSELRLEGTFAAAFAADFGKHPGAVLAYRNQSFTFDSGVGFETTPHQVLTNGGSAREMLGVAFDLAGNLYAVDTVTERLSAYGPNLQPLFTFGTPVPGGTTAEFYEPYALMFWPGAAPGDPGRLFIADAINNRIVAYRPNLAASTLDFLFSIEGFTIDGLDDAQPYALALDVATGRIATSDASGVGPRSWILQRRNLAAFDVQVLDAGGNEVESVCSGDPYMVQFGLTVPAGWPPVSGVLPVLTVAGQEQPPPTTTPVGLDAEDAATYSYVLTAPGSASAPFVGDLPLVASGTATALSDLLPRKGIVSVSNCFDPNPRPTISATPNIAPQASGWTAVEPGSFAVSLAAADDSAVTAIQYEFNGTNDLGFPFPVVANPSPSPAFGLTVSLPQPGYTTVRFRARDDDGNWSAWERLDVQLVEIRKAANLEGDVVSFAVHPADASGVTYSATGLPPGIAIDSRTGVLQGTITFDAANVYTVVLFETAGSAPSTHFSFTWEVRDVNRAPAGVDDTYQVDEDGVLQVAAPGVAANDADPDRDTFQIFLHTPAAGALTFNGDGSFRYVPDPDFNGVDAFRYQLRDQHGVQCDPIDVTLTVNPVNDAPTFVAGPSQHVLEDAGLQTISNWATGISAGRANESGQALTFVIANSNPALFATPPAISPSGVLSYRPAADRSGTAIITVHLQDNGGTASGGDDTSDTRTFTITVDPINDAPTAVADAHSMIEGGALTVPAPGVLANDTDIDSVALQAALVTGPAVGTLTLQANGAFTYTPPAGFIGSAAFTYAVTDGALSATAVITITVAPANLPPVCEAAVATPLVIWPVNHKAVYVSISGVTDPEARPVTIRFTGILQDEPTNTQGDGNTTQDGDIENGGARAWVRAERSGSNKVPGDGRVYLISFVATDAGGLMCRGTARVDVPHDQGGKPAVLSPGRWNSRTGQKLP